MVKLILDDDEAQALRALLTEKTNLSPASVSAGTWLELIEERAIGSDHALDETPAPKARRVT
jgi:hypothetical protein